MEGVAASVLVLVAAKENNYNDPRKIQQQPRPNGLTCDRNTFKSYGLRPLSCGRAPLALVLSRSVVATGMLWQVWHLLALS